jgi:hypothetical protein
MKPAARRVLAGTAVVAALLLSGCDAGVLSDDESEPEVPAAEPTVAAWANALPVGDTFDGPVATTVLAVTKDSDPSWEEPGENLEWLSADVRSCIPAGGSASEVGWYQWAASGTDGGWYPADLDYAGDEPADQYPRLAELAPGECVEGRILFAIPGQAEVTVLVNADETGAAQGSWLLGDVGLPGGQQ